MRILIIGNSATAVGAIDALRGHDQAAEVVVLSEEPHGIYSRPMLDHYLSGEVGASRLTYRPGSYYSQHNVQALLSTRVTAVRPAEHVVETEGGATLGYDRLLIATGGTPIVPPIAGLSGEGVFTFSRLDDAQALLRHIEERAVRRAVVLGGGMIGIKVTDALARRGIGVTMVELAPRILSAALNETASRMLTGVLAERGSRCSPSTIAGSFARTDASWACGRRTARDRDRGSGGGHRRAPERGPRRRGGSACGGDRGGRVYAHDGQGRLPPATSPRPMTWW